MTRNDTRLKEMTDSNNYVLSREFDLSSGHGLLIFTSKREEQRLGQANILGEQWIARRFRVQRNSNRELEPGSPLKGIESIVETEHPTTFLFPASLSPSLSPSFSFSVPLPNISSRTSASARAPIRVYASKIFMGSVRANIKMEAHDRKRGLMIIDNSAITSRARISLFLSLSLSLSLYLFLSNGVNWTVHPELNERLPRTRQRIFATIILHHFSTETSSKKISRFIISSFARRLGIFLELLFPSRFSPRMK